VVIGVLLVGIGVWWGVWAVDLLILGLLTVAILLTAATGFDPFYRVYGVTTKVGLRRLPCAEHGESCRPEFYS